MSPPQLAGNAPVADVPHPLEIGIRPICRNEFRPALFNSRNRRFRERLDLNKPLRRQQRFDNGVAALAMSDVILQRLGAHQKPLSVEVFQHAVPGLCAIESLVRAARPR